MNKKTKAEIQQENEELKKALHQRNAEAEALSRATPHPATFSTKMVPVKNFSGNLVSIPYEYAGQARTLLLESSGLRQTGVLPYEVWLNLERESALVAKGYIARTDQAITNPNIVDDVQEYLDEREEKDIAEAILKIENASTLYKMLDHLDGTDPSDRTSKELFVREHLKRRIFEITKVQIVDSEMS